MGVRLPPEYQEVEYLKSTGTQYILTDVTPSNTIGFDCVFFTTNKIAENDYGCIFGSRIKSGSYDFQLTTFSMLRKYPGRKGTLRFGPNDATGKDYDAEITINTRQRATLKNHIFTTPKGTSTTVMNYSWTYIVPIMLFGLNENGSFVQSGGGCYIYVMRFYDGSQLTHDFVPCYRKSDSKPGMYDLVTKQFFTNAGTGEFLVGPDVIDSISPWLVARRRGLMREPPLNTSPKIAEYGKALDRSNTGTSANADYAIRNGTI